MVGSLYAGRKFSATPDAFRFQCEKRIFPAIRGKFSKKCTLFAYMLMYVFVCLILFEA